MPPPPANSSPRKSPPTAMPRSWRGYSSGWDASPPSASTRSTPRPPRSTSCGGRSTCSREGSGSPWEAPGNISRAAGTDRTARPASRNTLRAAIRIGSRPSGYRAAGPAPAFAEPAARNGSYIAADPNKRHQLLLDPALRYLLVEAVLSGRVVLVEHVGSEHDVPDDQETPEVAVVVTRIPGVMEPVHFGRGEDIVEPPPPEIDVGMLEVVHRDHDYAERGDDCSAQQQHGAGDQRHVDDLHPEMLVKPGGEVQVGGSMMDLVDVPQERPAVERTMGPVIAKRDHQDTKQGEDHEGKRLIEME